MHNIMPMARFIYISKTTIVLVRHNSTTMCWSDDSKIQLVNLLYIFHKACRLRGVSRDSSSHMRTTHENGDRKHARKAKPYTNDRISNIVGILPEGNPAIDVCHRLWVIVREVTATST